ncbi:MAG: glycosyltransferase [Steroidobacteraceae bacterium]
MSVLSPTVLFVPVSGPSGMGEFARARSIADALTASQPATHVHFMLHRAAPYAANFHHPSTLLPASPTLCTREVVETIERLRPAIVVFDNAGRTPQLRAAKRVGAAVIYVSSRSRQRYKAFRLRWMRLIDEHWISYPELIAGAPSRIERFKLRWLRRPELHYLDTVLAPADDSAAEGLLADFGSPDIVIVPGGGSQFHDASMTPARFAEWGAALAAQGHRVVFVAGPSFVGELPQTSHFKTVRSVPGGALHALLARSRAVLVNGGDTLLQALALNKPCVAIPIAGDQAERIARCAAQGVVLSPKPDEVVASCERVLTDATVRSELETRRRLLALHDALPGIIERLGRYLGLR